MYVPRMRTTIELPDHLRADLLALAARRGEKGFSRIIQEAVTRYLADAEEGPALKARAREMVGSLSAEDAEALAAHAVAMRRKWR